MFESAAIEQKAAAKDKADKIASDVEKGQENETIEYGKDERICRKKKWK